jgi:hypothetical protein
MKKIIFSILIIAALLLPLLSSGCDKDTPPPTPTGPFEIKEFTVPEGLPNYALTIEWLNDTGEFNPNRPVMILFNGKSNFNVKENLTLDSLIYKYTSNTSADGGLSSYSKDMNLNLASYWIQQGYNVGIYHYENFSDDTPQNFFKKIFSSSANTYIDEDGSRISENLPPPLAEAFVTSWLKLMRDKPIKGTVYPNRQMEVRFIGNSTGAPLAVAAADYLSALFDKGYSNIDGFFVPTRVTLLNPYLDNAPADVLDDRTGNVITSALAYCADKVPALADKYVVFDTVESDAAFSQSYEAPYSGVTEREDSETVGSSTTMWTAYDLSDEGDAGLYKRIMGASAYLNLLETFSTFYPDAYKELDRAARDWYLYTINGTDDTGIGNTTINGYNDTRPMFDDRYNGGQSVIRYSVSAWTPTAYTRALRGHEFKQYTRTYQNSTYVKIRYTLKEFQAENFQVSGYDKAIICGYAYRQRDDSNNISFAADARLQNVEFALKIDASNGSSRTIAAKTGRDGFYTLEVPSADWNSTLSMTVSLPGPGYKYTVPTTEYTGYSQISLSAVKGEAINVSITTSAGAGQIVVKNAGFIKA